MAIRLLAFEIQSIVKPQVGILYLRISYQFICQAVCGGAGQDS